MSTMTFAPLRRAGPNPCLLLNADFRPLNLLPLSVLPAKRALRQLIKDKIIVVAEHDAVARFWNGAMPIPSVAVLKKYIDARRAPAFTRENVRLRDRFSCGYCASKFPATGLTYDHVIPKSRGGPTRWENIISACHACNGRKDNRTPQEAGMTLLWRPWKPSQEELWKASSWATRTLPEAWRPFLAA